MITMTRKPASTTTASVSFLNLVAEFVPRMKSHQSNFKWEGKKTNQNAFDKTRKLAIKSFLVLFLSFFCLCFVAVNKDIKREKQRTHRRKEKPENRKTEDNRNGDKESKVI